MSPGQSFPKRLSLNILFITSMLFIIAIGVAAVSSHVLIAQEATKSAENLLEATIQKIEKTLESVEVTVKNQSETVYDHLEDKDYPYALATHLIDSHSYIIGSTVAFREYYYPGFKYCSPYSYKEPATGLIVEKELGNEKYNYFEKEWYKIPVETGKGYWSEPYYDDGGGDCVMSTYSWPLKDGEGKVFAVMTADIPLNWVDSMLSAIKPYPNSMVSMISREGKFINVDKGLNIKDNDIFYCEQFIKSERTRTKIHSISEQMLAGERGVRQYVNGGMQSFVLFGPLENGWCLAITSDYKEVLART